MLLATFCSNLKTTLYNEWFWVTFGSQILEGRCISIRLQGQDQVEVALHGSALFIEPFLLVRVKLAGSTEGSFADRAGYDCWYL